MLFAVGEQRAVVPIERLLEIVVSGELVSLEVGVRQWEGRGGGSVALSNYRLTRRVGILENRRCRGGCRGPGCGAHLHAQDLALAYPFHVTVR